MIVKEEGQLQFWHIFAHPGVLNKQNECSLLIHVLLLVPRPFSVAVTWHAPWWLSSYNAFWVLLNPKALYKNKTIGLIFLMKRARHREVLQSDTTNKGGKRIQDRSKYHPVSLNLDWIRIQNHKNKKPVHKTTGNLYSTSLNDSYLTESKRVPFLLPLECLIITLNNFIYES